MGSSVNEVSVWLRFWGLMLKCSRDRNGFGLVFAVYTITPKWGEPDSNRHLFFCREVTEVPALLERSLRLLRTRDQYENGEPYRWATTP